MFSGFSSLTPTDSSNVAVPRVPGVGHILLHCSDDLLGPPLQIPARCHDGLEDRPFIAAPSV